MRSGVSNHGSTRAWNRRRQWWAQRLPVDCVRCGFPVNPGDDWHLDHPFPRKHGGQDADARPAHAVCNLRAGSRIDGNPTARFFPGATPPESGPRQQISPLEPESGPVGLGPEAPEWDAAPWLDELRQVPPDGTWPRLMTAPHPSAVGSYGPEAVAWVESNLGLTLRWWQRLTLARVLEYDAAGALVWLVALVSTPRQVGKSWGLRALLSWRIHQAARFGEAQLALHTGKDLNVCHEVQRPARAWARTRGYKVRETNGQQEIESPDGSRWIIRGRDSLYGYSASLAVVDEAWKVDAAVVEDGLEPTMAERQSPQLALVSTAHRMATPLMPDRRRAALVSLADPVDVLLVEWSAVRAQDLGDVAAWRAASPYWSASRERLVRATYDRAMAAEVSEDPDEPDPREAFRSQWLNVWPDRAVAQPGREEPLLPDGAWSACTDLSAIPEGPLVLGLEDYYGMGAGAVAAGRLPDGRVMVWGRTARTRAEGATWLAGLASTHPGTRVVIGSTLEPDPAVAVLGVPPVAATANHTRRGLALLREYALGGRLVHDGGAELTEQVTQCRVRHEPAGLVLGRGRADLVRAMAWAITDLVGEPEPVPSFRIV